MGWGLYNYNGASYHDTKGAGTRGHEAWKVVPNVATNGVSLRFELDCNAGTRLVWRLVGYVLPQAPTPPTPPPAAPAVGPPRPPSHRPSFSRAQFLSVSFSLRIATV